MTDISPISVRPEPFDAAGGAAQDKLRRGASAPAIEQRPSTSLGTNEVGAGDKRAQLKAAAQAFEAVFVRQMIGSMRQASLGEDLLGSRATEQFREMSDAKVADQMAANGSLGIAQLLLNQFEAKVGGPEPREADE